MSIITQKDSLHYRLISVFFFFFICVNVNRTYLRSILFKYIYELFSLNVIKNIVT